MVSVLVAAKMSNCDEYPRINIRPQIAQIYTDNTNCPDKYERLKDIFSSVPTCAICD